MSGRGVQSLAGDDARSAHGWMDRRMDGGMGGRVGGWVDEGREAGRQGGRGRGRDGRAQGGGLEGGCVRSGFAHLCVEQHCDNAEEGKGVGEEDVGDEGERVVDCVEVRGEPARRGTRGNRLSRTGAM